MINEDRLISTFIDLAKISSPSWKENAVIAYIEKAVKETGLTSKRLPCGNSFNLLVKIPGDPLRKPLMFSAHTDTVTPCENVRPVVMSDRITSDGTTILGGDDKAAIAAFIEAARIITENKISTPPVEFVFTCAEEVGLLGMKGMDYKAVASKRAFVLDCSGSVGEIIYRAPSQIIMHAEIIGKASHAGIEPEKGISAINIAAEIITKLPKGRIDKETTLNVGMITGGRATNIVAEHASIDLEMRSLDHAKMLRLEKKVISTIKTTVKRYKGKARIKSSIEYKGFNIAQTDPVSKLAINACKKCKIKPVFMPSGGGSDTNVLNARGIRSLNLAIGMSNVHSTREFILKKDIINGCRLVLAIAENA